MNLKSRFVGLALGLGIIGTIVVGGAATASASTPTQQTSSSAGQDSQPTSNYVKQPKANDDQEIGGDRNVAPKCNIKCPKSHFKTVNETEYRSTWRHGHKVLIAKVYRVTYWVTYDLVYDRCHHVWKCVECKHLVSKCFLYWYYTKLGPRSHHYYALAG